MPFVPIIIPSEDPSVRDTQCRLVLKQFEPSTATVEQRRDYARCVDRLDGTGKPLSVEALVIVKGLVLLALLGAVLGAWKGWREDGVFGAALLGFVGAVILPCAAGFVGGLILAVAWVFGFVS